MSEHANSAENIEAEGTCPHCHSGKHKERDDKEYKDHVRKMVEEGQDCTDVLIQVSAITSALNSFNKVLLANHMRTCVADNIREGNDEVIDELVTTLQKLMK